jgi:hypothetical protein
MKNIPKHWRWYLLVISIISLGGMVWLFNSNDYIFFNILPISSIVFFLSLDLILVKSKRSTYLKILIPLISYAIFFISFWWGYFLPDAGIVGLGILEMIELPIIFLHPIVLLLYGWKTNNLKDIAIKTSVSYTIVILVLVLYGIYGFPKP